jgi:hypothetical protein
MQHVDLVKNEWLAGFQHVVARVYRDNGTSLRLDSPEPDKWEHLLHTELVDRGSGDTIDPDAQPDEFFTRMHLLVAGDYLFATTPHEDHDCPYEASLVVPIERPEAASHDAQPV